MTRSPSLFKFVPKLTSVVTKDTDHVVRIPAGITDRQELCTLLKQELGLQTYCQPNWDSLYECITSTVCAEVRSRFLILHEDVPPLRPLIKGTDLIKGYLNVLLDTVKKVQECQQDAEKRLLVVFPLPCIDTIDTILNDIDGWELISRFWDGPELSVVRHPSESDIQQLLTQLNGITVECLTLVSEKYGQFDILAVPWAEGYIFRYAPRDQSPAFLSARLQTEGILQAFFPYSSMISKQDAYMSVLPMVLKFYHDGNISPAIVWNMNYSDIDSLDMFLYANKQEMFIEWNIDLVREGIIEGTLQCMKQAKAFDRDSWQRRLSNGDEQERLTALCVVGREQSSQMRSFLLPFLSSPQEKERWISARFLAPLGEKQALPILLDMLAWREAPPHMPAENRLWYTRWRRYAPRLVRGWASPAIVATLQNALQYHLTLPLELEENMDEDFFLQEICHELGYRGELDTLQGFPLANDCVKLAWCSLVGGYAAYLYRESALSQQLPGNWEWQNAYINMQDCFEILINQCHLSRTDADSIIDML